VFPRGEGNCSHETYLRKGGFSGKKKGTRAPGGEKNRGLTSSTFSREKKRTSLRSFEKERRARHAKKKGKKEKSGSLSSPKRLSAPLVSAVGRGSTSGFHATSKRKGKKKGPPGAMREKRGWKREGEGEEKGKPTSGETASPPSRSRTWKRGERYTSAFFLWEERKRKKAPASRRIENEQPREKRRSARQAGSISSGGSQKERDCSERGGEPSCDVAQREEKGRGGRAEEAASPLRAS